MMGLFDTPIVHGVLIRAPREKVFETLTTAQGWDAWFTKGTQIDLRPDGEIIFRWVEWGPERRTFEDNGAVVTVNAPENFVFTWHDHTTTVEIDLVEVEGGTEVWLCDAGYPDTPEGRELLVDCAAGWGEALTLLKMYLEHGITY